MENCLHFPKTPKRVATNPPAAMTTMSSNIDFIRVDCDLRPCPFFVLPAERSAAVNSNNMVMMTTSPIPPSEAAALHYYAMPIPFVVTMDAMKRKKNYLSRPHRTTVSLRPSSASAVAVTLPLILLMILYTPHCSPSQQRHCPSQEPSLATQTML